MGLSPRAGLFGGVALLSAAVVLLQIVLTRLFSALFGHHLAFLAISLALFGVGVGGALLYAAPALARPPGLLARLSTLSCLASAATLATILFLVRQKPIGGLGASDVGRLALLYAVCAAPFTLAGIAITGAIQHAARDMSKLYLADLAAAAAGGAAAMLALRIGAPRAVLVVAVLCAVAGLWFAWPMRRAASPGRSRSVAMGPQAAPNPGEQGSRSVAMGPQAAPNPGEQGSRSVAMGPQAAPNPGEQGSPVSQRLPGMRPPFGLVATMLLGSTVLLAGDFGAPWLKLGDVGEVRVDKADFQKWSLLSLVTVERPVGGTAWMRMDGGAASAIHDAKTNPPVHPVEMGYALHRSQGPALVIGAGGGRDVRAALKAGQKKIDAVEVDPVVVNDVMRGAFQDFSGDLYGKPEVKVTVADGRSFVRASNEKYRAIVLSQVHTEAASAVGALALSEAGLYTVEAFRDYLEHLVPEGTLTVSRWNGEAPRLLGLAAAGLRAAGAESPKAHMFACSHEQTTALLVKREPLAKDELQKLRRHCNQHRFREVFAPDTKRGELEEQLVASRAGFVDPKTGLDLRAPTDDRPFFFHTVPASRALKLVGSPQELAREQGLAVLFGLFAASAALAVLCLLVPLAIGGLRSRLAKREDQRAPAAREPRGRPLAFFVCLGAGLVLVEVGVIQQLALFLGHPVYAVTVALVALLLSAGAGSLSTSRVALAAAPRMGARRAQILVGLLSLYAVALGPVLGRAIALPFGLRVLFTVALLVPIGALMGSLAPLGVKLVAPRSASILPWCWGLGGLASVMGTAVAAFVAMSFGFSATLLAAGAAYLFAAMTVPRYRGEGAPIAGQGLFPDLRGRNP